MKIIQILTKVKQWLAVLSATMETFVGKASEEGLLISKDITNETEK